jgi:hypothetical protein
MLNALTMVVVILLNAELVIMLYAVLLNAGAPKNQPPKLQLGQK